MKLGQYKRKRNFDKTPEPAGHASKSNGLHFYIQKHAATQLHFDLRLELDGVLKSWAVPKGPPNDPSEKRLAIQVEDHPLEYGSFEGEIPKGNYGAGKVIVWDRGYYSSLETDDIQKSKKLLRQGFSDGEVKFMLHGNKLNGGYALIQLKNQEGNKWLFIKEKEKSFSFSKEARKHGKEIMPHDIKPMLAKRVDEPFDREGWIFEIKWDGYRAIAEVSNKEVKLYSRTGNDLKKRFPTISEELETFKGEAVFDGEIVAFKNGKPDFHALQNYEEDKPPIQYVIFDLLYLNGVDQRSLPLSERKDNLMGLFKSSKHIIISDYVKDRGREYFNAVKKQKLEGIVAKDGSGSYLEGTRTTSWLKIKNVESQEAIIIGYTAPRASRKYFGALVLGTYQGSKLKYIGHSGGGFTEKELAEIYKKLNKIKQKTSPVIEKVPINSPITWVKPKYVCEINFAEWTPSGIMRQPIYLGMRDDKKPSEVKREEVLEVKKTKRNTNATMPDEVKISHPDKIYWPKEGYTKKDLIDYYEKVADTMLPYLKDRPENLLRNPEGITKKGFFNKDINFAIPEFASAKKIQSESKGAKINYLLCQNKETLLFMANLGCIEINPWNSRIDNPDKPDYMIIDLDPGKRDLKDLIKVAREVNETLQLMCIKSYVKTSGKSGLHIFIPLAAEYSYNEIRPFTLMIAKLIHKRQPELTSIERHPEKRNGKIYLDYLQNRRGQTIAAAYSVRPVEGATVSTPLEWSEIKPGLDPKKFTIKTILLRIKKKGDLWKPVLGKGIDIQESLKCLERNYDKI